VAQPRAGRGRRVEEGRTGLSDEPLVVACSADAAYLPHAATMLHSVMTNAGGLRVEAHVLHGPKLDKRALEKVVAMAERTGAALATHEIPDARIEGLPGIHQAGIPSTIWYRVDLPQLLPATERVLYLDGDTLAVDSLAPLWQTDLTGNHVGAVTNVFEPWNLGYPGSMGLELSGPRSYFNSGVLLMNLEQMRRDECSTAIREWALANRDRLPWGDQDALNAVLAERRVELHPRWNCMNSVLLFDSASDVFGAEAVAEARARPGIRHFEGPGQNKPWHLLAPRDVREVYMRHRRETPWPRLRPSGITPRNLIKRLS
jgi:UDP-glucose/galactose:(glucosyl)LPS alpha-1,2-glucosyl/galactosyltransferase